MPHIDIEKGGAMTDSKRGKSPRRINKSVLKCSTFPTNLRTTIPLTIAYTALYLTNYYVSPSGPGSHHRDGDSKRIQALIIILMLLGPDIIREAFAVTTTSAQNESPCFGFGWLAYSASMLIPVVSGSDDVLPREDFGVKVVGMDGEMVRTRRKRRNGGFGVWKLLRDLESRYIPETGDSDTVIEMLKPSCLSTPKSFWTAMQNRSTAATGISQSCLAGVFWYYYGDLSVLLLLSASILLLEATANLPIWSAQIFPPRAGGTEVGVYALMHDTGSSPRHIYIIQPAHSKTCTNKGNTASNTVKHSSVPAVVLISGGFLIQALLCTQLSDAAAMAMMIIMFVGTISNVAIAALSREPVVGGMRLQSVDVIRGQGGIVAALKALEGRYAGYGELWIKECFPDRLGEWESRKENVIRMRDVGEMD